VVADAAYATCLRLARQHYENFPVASGLLPKAWRPHVAALYGFARIADDFADEGDRPDEARLSLLDDWRRRLDDAMNGVTPDDGSDAAAVFVALADTVRRFDLDPSLLADLISAFRQDVLVKRYESWDDVLDYCRRSANPVGRLVLGIAGRRGADLESWSDDICTALQLTNFWQDLEIDWRKGRLYVPLALVRDCHADERDLGRRRMTAEWRAVMSAAAQRTRTLFHSGRPLVNAVSGRLRWELRATWLGGTRILDRLDNAGFDVFHRRPTLGWRDSVPLFWKMMVWSA